MKAFNPQADLLEQSVFSKITQMAIREEAINLAQGFPDFDGPEWVLQEAQKVLLEQKNQYAPSMGILPLRETVAELYQHFYNLNYDPQTEILITNGATEAIFATIQALVEPGDEVIVFEPLYDSYLASIKMARGVAKPVTLHAPDFVMDWQELESQLSEKTKLLIFNNPHNPTGHVFTKEDLQKLAELSEKFDFYILSDEVYEYLTFGVDHMPTAQIPQLKERTITTSSIGKTLSLTGWKLGWACGPTKLIEVIHKVHQYICFCVHQPTQVTLSRTLKKWPQHVGEFRADYTKKRDLLVGELENLGAQVIPPQGSYFTLVKTPGIQDWEFCEKLILENKVATIPLSPFYLKSNEGESMVRFCFAKKEETLKQALKNLQGAAF